MSAATDARQYATNVAWREQGGVEGDPFGLLPPLLALPCNITGCRVADLGQPVPGIAGRFDAVASYLVLNDVRDYRGFAATLAASLKPGGRAVLALNNPTAPSPAGTSRALPSLHAPAVQAATAQKSASPEMPQRYRLLGRPLRRHVT